MENGIFTTLVDKWMFTGCEQLLSNIPSGSGVLRLIDIVPSQYQTGFVSLSGGSFKAACESGNWAGTDLKTCFAEAHPTGSPIYEVTKFNQDTPVLSMFYLPEEFQYAIYMDKDLASPDKYVKSQIVMDLAGKYLPADSFSGVYSPSRRNPEGGVLLYNPVTLPSVEITYTGQAPPSGNVIDWI